MMMAAKWKKRVAFMGESLTERQAVEWNESPKAGDQADQEEQPEEQAPDKLGSEDGRIHEKELHVHHWTEDETNIVNLGFEFRFPVLLQGVKNPDANLFPEFHC